MKEVRFHFLLRVYTSGGNVRCAGNLMSTARMARIDGYSFSGLEHRDIRLGEKGAANRLGENGRFHPPYFPHTLSPE